MKSKIKSGLFWLSVLLCLLVGVNVWPARVALGPSPGLGSTLEDDDTDYLELGRVAAYGCLLESPVVVAGKVGWRVAVWADYNKKEKGQAHDWEKWLSFRAGKNADKKADEDCREWRRALAKRIEKMAEGKRSGGQKSAAGAGKRPER